MDPGKLIGRGIFWGKSKLERLHKQYEDLRAVYCARLEELGCGHYLNMSDDFLNREKERINNSGYSALTIKLQSGIDIAIGANHQLSIIAKQIEKEGGRAGRF